MEWLETSKLVDCLVPVRPLDRDKPSFKQLYQSIKRNGVLMPVLVKPTNLGYMVFDGLQRLDISRTIGATTMPSIVYDITDGEMIVLQLQLNTYNARQFDMQLLRLVATDQWITLSGLAEMISVNPNKLLDSSLLRALPAVISMEVIDGKICLSNAIALNRLARENSQEALNWVSKARRQPPIQFMGPCHNAARVARDEKRAARSK